MQHANASAPRTADAVDLGLRGEDLLAAYLDHLHATGRGNLSYERAARRFFRTWPDPQAWATQPLADRLAADKATRPVITYLMLHQGLHPGYDYLLERKLSPIWREIHGSPLQDEITRFLDAAESLGFTMRVRLGTGSQVPARLLIQTGRRIAELVEDDLDEFAEACQERTRRTGKSHRHYLSAISNTHTVVPPRHPALAATVGWAGAAGGAAGAGDRADPGRDGRLPGTEEGDLSRQDGLGAGDPAPALWCLRDHPRPRADHGQEP